MSNSSLDSKNILVDTTAAGNEISPLVVSSQMSYGSYSGADVKVIVHHPIDHAGLKANEEEKAELEDQIIQQRDYQYYLVGAAEDPFSDSSVKAIKDSEKQIEILEQQIRELENNISTQNLKTNKVLAEIQTFSWSIHREKDPVRSLGSVYPRGFTRGGRTISGTMVFTVFYEHVLHEVLRMNLRYKNTGTTDNDPYLATTMLPDQLPPLDLTLLFANEYGSISSMGLYGVEFFNEGGTFSIEDIYSEATMHYVARDIDPMRAVAQREIDSKGVGEHWQTTASDMLQEKRYLERGHIYRRNPFI